MAKKKTTRKKTVSLVELAKEVAASEGLTQAAAKAAVLKTFERIVAHASKGNAVSIPGYGRFRLSHRKARTGTSPATGRKIKIAASRSVAFRLAKATKDKLNRR